MALKPQHCIGKESAGKSLGLTLVVDANDDGSLRDLVQFEGTNYGMVIYMAGWRCAEGTAPALPFALNWRLYQGSLAIFEEVPVFAGTTWLTALNGQRTGLMVSVVGLQSDAWILRCSYPNPGGAMFRLTGSVSLSPVMTLGSGLEITVGSCIG